MAEFSSSPLPSTLPNDLYNFADVQHNQLANQGAALQNQGAQQQLTNAQTVRDNAVAVGQGDQTATSISAAANPDLTAGVISAGLNQSAGARANSAWRLGQASQAAGAILNMPDDQKQAAYTAIRNTAVGNDPSLQAAMPAAVPSDAELVAMRKAAIPAATLMDHYSQALRPMGSGDALDNPTVTTAPTGSGAAAGNGPTPAGAMSQSLGIRESNPGGAAPNYKAVNGAGYLGGYQFGSARLNDLGVYQPAKGENVNGNSYQGAFNIPGHPEVKTASDFLNSPDAQNVVQTMSMHNIDSAIQATPGAQNYSEAGLQWVAHLGGVAGMQKFVKSGGKYNPGDSNGTTLSQYYAEGSAHGTISQPHPFQAAQPGAAPTQQASTAPAPGSDPQSYAASGTAPPPGMAPAPQQTASAAPAAPGSAPAAPYRPMLADLGISSHSGGSVAAAPGTQVASLSGTSGLPMAATDAGGAQPGVSAPAAAAPNLPVSGAAPVGQSGPAPGAPAPAGSLGGAGPAQIQPNQLSDVGIPPTSSATSPPASANSPGQIPPGYQMMMRNGQPAGLFSTATGLPYMAPKVDVKDGVAITSNPLTNQITGTNRLFDTRRDMDVTDQTGVRHVIDASGHPLATFGTPTYQPDMLQWKQDQKDVQDAGDDLQTLQAQQGKLLEARSLAAQLPTGANADSRAAWSQYAHTYLPDSVASSLDAKLNLPGAVPASEFQKIMTQAATGQEKDAVGARGGYFLTKIFMGANPGLALQPNANRDILNMQAVANQANQDYLQGLQGWVNDKGDAFTASAGQTRYQSSNKFDQQWQAQRNPQVYLAATQAMNQKPFAEWSKGLQPAEIQRAVGIIGRVDPGTSFLGADGKAKVVASPAGAQPAAGRQAPTGAAPAQPAGIQAGATATGPSGQKIRFDGNAWGPMQ